ncbi:MAG: hypothetical protein AB7E37_07000, partial [Candidatus Altimarinota bacterium]
MLKYQCFICIDSSYVLLIVSGLPDYKLKQGETFDSLKIEKFYMDNFSKVLDEYLENEDII